MVEPDNTARDARRARASAGKEQAQVSKQAVDSTVASRVKMVQMDEMDEGRLTGVTNIDRGEASADQLFARAVMLAAGDIAMLLLFAAVGRGSHSEAILSAELLATAGPFILGWLLAAPVTGAFSPQACSNKMDAAVLAAAKTWLVGIPTGLVLRSIFKGYMVPKAFAVVTMVATLVLLVGWRLGAAKLIPMTADGGGTGKGNRKGGPFEFLKLLFGLSTRW